MRFTKWIIDVTMIASAVHILSLIIEKEFDVNIPSVIIALTVTITAEVLGVNDF